jgi:hypothetical protein
MGCGSSAPKGAKDVEPVAKSAALTAVTPGPKQTAVTPAKEGVTDMMMPSEKKRLAEEAEKAKKKEAAKALISSLKGPSPAAPAPKKAADTAPKRQKINGDLPPEIQALLGTQPWKLMDPDIFPKNMEGVWKHYSVAPAYKIMKVEGIVRMAAHSVECYYEREGQILKHKHKKWTQDKVVREIERKFYRSGRPLLPGADKSQATRCSEFYYASEMRLKGGKVTRSEFYLSFARAHNALFSCIPKPDLARESIVAKLQSKRLLGGLVNSGADLKSHKKPDECERNQIQQGEKRKAKKKTQKGQHVRFRR